MIFTAVSSSPLDESSSDTFVGFFLLADLEAFEKLGRQLVCFVPFLALLLLRYHRHWTNLQK